MEQAAGTLQSHSHPNAHYDPTSGTETANGDNTNLKLIRNEIALLLHEEPLSSRSQRLHRILDNLPADAPEWAFKPELATFHLL